MAAQCLYFASGLRGVSGLLRPGSRIQCGKTEWGRREAGEEASSAGKKGRLRNDPTLPRC